MERKRNEPLFDTVNAELAEALKWWHDDPYSSGSADKINTLISLAQSAGYGITLEVDKKSWEDKNADEKLSQVRLVRHITEGDKEIVEIDPPKNADKDETIFLFGIVDHPRDEFTPSSASFTIRCNDKWVEFLPQDVSSLQIVKELTFRTLREVKNRYMPNISEKDFFLMIDRGEIPESLKRAVKRIRKVNGSESEPE
jgi:hypothetical protein